MRLRGASGRLLGALSERCGKDLSVEEVRTRPWASATFTGARHLLKLRLDGPDAKDAADRLVDGLGEAEFDLGTDLLVDIAATDRRHNADGVEVTIEALTVEGD